MKPWFDLGSSNADRHAICCDLVLFTTDPFLWGWHSFDNVRCVCVPVFLNACHWWKVGCVFMHCLPLPSACSHWGISVTSRYSSTHGWLPTSGYVEATKHSNLTGILKAQATSQKEVSGTNSMKRIICRNGLMVPNKQWSCVPTRTSRSRTIDLVRRLESQINICASLNMY